MNDSTDTKDGRKELELHYYKVLAPSAKWYSAV
jgi:hypothetical protein